MASAEHIDQFDLVSREGWGPGPWDGEPDRREWVHGEFLCQVNRTSWSGHLCGYVGVEEHHPLHGKDYSDRVPLTQEIGDKEINLDHQSAVDVFLEACGEHEEGTISLSLASGAHGGLTYAGEFASGEWSGYWFFGFDCAHSGDGQPGRQGDPLFGQGEYRALGYVQREVTKLANFLEGWK